MDLKNAIATDLGKRGLSLQSLICTNEAGEFLIISYNEQGEVQFLSATASNLEISERLEGNLVKNIAVISHPEVKQNDQT